ncbi:hypothetical protein IMCC12053_184 [Celeribacter marinus]|uniref:Uncharacterized protein n=1 Tax=Celeribacter marinus TaxID=1397108 RepID=A0A0N9ZBT3_9RHOB|nr:hypothetical protein IMCC12053_184 [Celeribacter marinus]
MRAGGVHSQIPKQQKRKKALHDEVARRKRRGSGQLYH